MTSSIVLFGPDLIGSAPKMRTFIKTRSFISLPDHIRGEEVNLARQWIAATAGETIANVVPSFDGVPFQGAAHHGQEEI